MRRISIFISNLNRGGAEKQALLLAKYLTPYFETDILTFYPGNQYKEFIEKNDLSIIALKGLVIRKLYDLYKYFKKNTDTVLFNYSPINNIFGTIIGKIAGISKNYCGIRSANFVIQYYKIIIQKFACNKYSDLIITNSYESLKKYGEVGFKLNKFKVIHNCVELPDFNRINDRSQYINILTVSRFIKFKGIECSIKAVEYLLTRYPQLRSKVKFRLVGYGFLETEIESLISELKLNDVITIYNGKEDITRHYKESHIYLSTSLTEGLSNSIMEAMSFSMPVVATDVGDNRFLIKEGINGYLCKVNDYISVAESLYNIISNVDIRKRFSSMSLNLIKDNFSPDVLINEYFKLIEA